MRSRTRTEKYVEYVEVGGESRPVELTRQVPVEAEPRDWDRLRERGGMVATGLVVVGALAWSVASIGSLLSALGPVWLAYTVAVVFDLAWVLAMNLEHELRFEPRKQRVPKVFGWVLLAVSVSVIFLHGIQAASWAVALSGSVIAILAKLLWNMRVWAKSRKLGDKTQGWLNSKLDDIHAEHAVAVAKRKIGYVVNETRAIGSATAVPRQYHESAVAVPREYHGTATVAGESATAVPPATTEIRWLNRDTAIDGLAEMIRAGEKVSLTETMALTGKPQSTAARYLREAKLKANEGTGNYL